MFYSIVNRSNVLWNLFSYEGVEQLKFKLEQGKKNVQKQNKKEKILRIAQIFHLRRSPLKKMS